MTSHCRDPPRGVCPGTAPDAPAVRPVANAEHREAWWGWQHRCAQGVVLVSQSKCNAPTASGKRCQRLAMIGASRCNLHRGEWSPYTIEKRKAKGRKRKKK